MIEELSPWLTTSSPPLSRPPVTIPTDEHETIVHPDLVEVELDCQPLVSQNQAQLMVREAQTTFRHRHQSLNA
jgi:hypothetical protein